MSTPRTDCEAISPALVTKQINRMKNQRDNLLKPMRDKAVEERDALAKELAEIQSPDWAMKLANAIWNREATEDELNAPEEYSLRKIAAIIEMRTNRTP